MNDVIFGQYYPTKSFVHNMDARVKLLLTIAYMVMVFLIDNFYGYALAVGFIVLAVIFSRVPFLSVLRSIKGVTFLAVFTAVLNLFFYSSGEVVFEFWIIKIKDEALIMTAFMALRLFLLVLGTCLLTLTTAPVDLTSAIESVLKPLKVVKFPVESLALVMSIALRFIPTLMNEADRIIKAQKARGADFESRNIFKKAKAMLPILIPLLVSSFQRAEELALAMDARCFKGGKGRTKYKKMKMTWRDLIGFLIVAGSITGVVLLNMHFGAV